MKAYIINIKLENSSPLIWRRVILPAGATYRRLHDVIQNVTNFKSGYPYGGYHLYEFELEKENRVVTEDEEAYLQHQHYKKNKAYYEERLKTIPKNMLKLEEHYQNRLKLEVRKPTGLKIDTYLESYKELTYMYDFGDGWSFKIELEDIVDDYYFGYPTLLDGAETAPPEDSGGLYGFESFLEAYYDKNHKDHKETVDWAKSQGFREYDPDRINESLKGLKYKKTQWDKINHERYVIIEDKYRKRS